MSNFSALQVKHVFRRGKAARAHLLIITVSLGIGLSSIGTMMGILESLFFRSPAGVDKLGEVVAIGKWTSNDNATYPDFRDLLESSRSFSKLGAFVVFDYTVFVQERATAIRGMLASGSLLSVLGTKPVRGRALTADDDRVGAPEVALVTYPFARVNFGEAGKAIGKLLGVGGKKYEIIGLLPSDFTAPDLSQVDAVFPLTNTPWFGSDRAFASRDYHWLRILGRLRAGATSSQASAEVSALLQQGAASRGTDSNEMLRKPIVPVSGLTEARRNRDSPVARISVWMSFLSAMLFIIGSTNALTLGFLERVRNRRQNAIEFAMGLPTSIRLTRAIVLALFVIVIVGVIAIAATVLAWNTIASSGIIALPSLPHMSIHIVELLCGLATVSSIGVLIPAFSGSFHSTSTAHLSNGTASLSKRKLSTFRLLLALQVALSVLLVGAASEFVLSLRNALAIDLGTVPQRLVVASVDLRAAGLTAAEASQTMDRLIHEIRTLPNVKQVGMTNAAAAPGFITFPVSADNAIIMQTGDAAITSVNMITHDYLAALGLHILNGRSLTSADENSGGVVVSKAFAKTRWASRNPIGQCIRIGKGNASCGTVVGVVNDRHLTVTDLAGSSEVYFPYKSSLIPANLQATFFGRELAVRLNREGGKTEEQVRSAILRIIPTLTAVRVRTGEEYFGPLYSTWRLGAVVIGFFGVEAIVLAGIGIYGVSATTTARRINELCIRMAVGASPGDNFILILRESLIVTVTGVLLGLGAIVLASGVAKKFAFGMAQFEYRIYLIPTVVLFVISVVSSIPSARRAAKINLAAAMRS